MARYAITFDLDNSRLEDLYHNDSWKNAYADVRRVLGEWRFQPQQGSVYFSEGDCRPVDCILAVQDIAGRFDWFEPSVSDIRMLRIEEEDDLMSAIRPSNRRKKSRD